MTNLCFTSALFGCSVSSHGFQQKALRFPDSRGSPARGASDVNGQDDAAGTLIRSAAVHAAYHGAPRAVDTGQGAVVRRWHDRAWRRWGDHAQGFYLYSPAMNIQSCHNVVLHQHSIKRHGHSLQRHGWRIARRRRGCCSTVSRWRDGYDAALSSPISVIS
jgi:hypothetical protein